MIDSTINLSLLKEACGTYDIPGRLQQLFMDADELSSDITAARDVLRCAQDALSIEEGEELLPSILALTALRYKLESVLYDFRIHYVMTERDQEAAGVQRIIEAAQNYESTKFKTK